MMGSCSTGGEPSPQKACVAFLPADQAFGAKDAPDHAIGLVAKWGGMYTATHLLRGWHLTICPLLCCCAGGNDLFSCMWLALAFELRQFTPVYTGLVDLGYSKTRSQSPW